MFITSEIAKTRTNHKLQIYKSGRILPILAQKELLGSNSHRGLINQLRELLGLSDEDFELLYGQAIYQYAEFVQVLPAQSSGPLSGLLNQGLARAWLTLKNYLTEYGNSDHLYNYAVFTAALLFDASKVIINQKIFLVDGEGNYLEDWNPFVGSMLGQAEFYKIYIISPIFQRLQHSITPILARQILPPEGFLWLTADLQVFVDWLNALRGDASEGGRISRALAYIKLDDILALAHSLVQVPVDMKESPINEHGEAFYKWLKEGLVNGDIKVNSADSSVHIVSEGVFIDRKLFKQFTDVYNVPVNMNVVFAQFGNLMGITKKSGGDFLFDQFFSEGKEAKGKDIKVQKVSSFGGPLNASQRATREGVVISDSSLIFTHSQVPDASPLLKAMQVKTLESHNIPMILQQHLQAQMKAK